MMNIRVLSENAEDRYYLSWIAFGCIGFLYEVTNLFQNEMVWKYKFRDTAKEWNTVSNVTSDLADDLDTYVSYMNYSIPIAVLFAEIFYTKKINTAHKMMACVTGHICVYFLYIIFTIIDTDSWQKEFFYIMIVVNLLSSVSKFFFLTSFVYISAGFPLIYTTAVTSGQSICGLLASVTRILISIVDGSIKTNGLFYFIIALLCLVITLILFFLALMHSNVFQYYTRQLAIKPLVPIFSRRSIEAALVVQYIVVFVAGTTVMIQPDLTSTINSMNYGKGYYWNDRYFVPVVTYLLFYICDLSGKVIAVGFSALQDKPLNTSIMGVLSIFRFVLVPLLLIINVTDINESEYVFKSDILYVMFEILLGVTNGIEVNICLVYASTRIKNLDEENNALPNLMMLGGILMASLFSFLEPLVAKLL